MRVENSNGREILTIDDWKTIYGKATFLRQWKRGRSAYAMADFIINRGGISEIQKRVSEVIEQPVVLEKTIPEYEVLFDQFPKGRTHDLAIFGRSGHNSIFIGVEAKVDEPFGDTVSNRYKASLAKQSEGSDTKVPERIRQLLKLHFKAPDSSTYNVRYQLLYTTAGTLAVGADISILYFIIFRTQSYSEKMGQRNYKDYTYFMEKLGAIPLDTWRKPNLGHKLSINGKKLISLYDYY